MFLPMQFNVDNTVLARDGEIISYINTLTVPSKIYTIGIWLGESTILGFQIHSHRSGNYVSSRVSLCQCF